MWGEVISRTNLLCGCRWNTQEQAKSDQFAPAVVKNLSREEKRCSVSKLAPLPSINPCAQRLPNLAHIPLPLCGVGTRVQIEEGTVKLSLILPGKEAEITATQLNAGMLLPRSHLLCFPKQRDKAGYADIYFPGGWNWKQNAVKCFA